MGQPGQREGAGGSNSRAVPHPENPPLDPVSVIGGVQRHTKAGQGKELALTDQNDDTQHEQQGERVPTNTSPAGASGDRESPRRTEQESAQLGPEPAMTLRQNHSFLFRAGASQPTVEVG